MSGESIPFNPIPRLGHPEEAIDLLDPAQHFQGDFPSPSLKEEEAERVEKAEKAAIEAERQAKEKKKLEASRKARKVSAGRKGRKASIVTGPLGLVEEPNIRRAQLGAGA